MKVLVVEDSDILRDSLCRGLCASGHVVETARDGEIGLWHAEEAAYDVLLLDIGLPKLDGLELLTRLRAGGVRTPVLLLTARDGVDERVRGLRAGADDYVVKPFAFEEVLARIEALARRASGHAANEIVAGDLALDLAARTVRIAGVPVALPRREYALLELLALRIGVVVARAEIERRIYDERVEPNSNVIDAAVSLLRKAIDPEGGPSRIETRRGQGYRLREA